MNDALKILESNELMRHIILFKLYVESKGEALKQIFDIKTDIINLYEDNFNNELYLINIKYLHVNKNYINRNATYLTFEGINYFENWIKSFEKLSEEEKLILDKKLPEKIFDFFKFSKEMTNTLSFLNQILKLAERL
ncbi:hypothetical protein ACFSKN_07060 [Mariniflexile gromovii]|uniref:Uncharacterized protein n=1 Tax=Mariniflexile gromovii TaxID=362523 RepID=A0ABS4BQA1_9FLAO|nr:hypothetical protein [Mariniflexile gromovii]MBP0902762.1 hypothetical protein [Mariniflexile gromovii]